MQGYHTEDRERVILVYLYRNPKEKDWFVENVAISHGEFKDGEK